MGRQPTDGEPGETISQEPTPPSAAPRMTTLGSQPAAPVDTMGFASAATDPSRTDEILAYPFPVRDWDRYEFIRPLGQGAMGMVYMAHDRHLDRVVALKFIRGGDQRLVTRLQQEARVQARIDHPSICQVFEVGQIQNQAYIAMQYIPGRSLEQARRELSLSEKVMVIRDVALAINEAHRLGVLHRDIKPSNIMVDRKPDGRLSAVVMDFGLARATGRNDGLTESGAVLGTPAYMSPEQARGETRQLDRRSDVYSLGATLYELFAGHPPFEGENVTMVLLSAVSEEPKPLRREKADIPVDLETITMKCLSKEAGLRYDSARALAEDLDRYLSGEPILGRPSSIWHRVNRLARRNRTAFAIAMVSLATLLLLLAYGAKVQLGLRRERAQAAALTKLTQELAQDIKEMEWFMRSVHQMPVHRISYAHRLLNARIEQIASQHRGLSEQGQGLLHYAQAQGYLSLQKIDSAYEHLLAAQRKGIATPELRWTLGRVLGELYARKLQELLRSGDANFVRTRKKELEEQLLQPAVAALEGSQGIKLGSAQYLLALSALYRRQYDDALQKAQESTAEAPWMYEGRKLIADVHFARAIDSMNRLDFKAATTGLVQAIRAYEAATEIGRSDALLYEQIAESYLLLAELDVRQKEISAPANPEQAIANCQKAILIWPERSTCYGKLTRAYAWLTMTDARMARNPTENFQHLEQAAAAAIAQDPQDAYVYDALGRGQLWFAWYEQERGIDPISHYDAALENFNSALKLIPLFPFCLNNVAILHIGKSEYLWSKKGTIDNRELSQAKVILEKAISIDPKYVATCPNLLSLFRYQIFFAVTSGRDPGAVVREMEEQGQKCLQQTDNSSLYLKMILGYSGYVDYLYWQRQEVVLGEVVEKQRLLLTRLLERSSISSHRTLGSGLFALAQARSLVLRQQDPGPAIESGRQALATSIEAPSQRAWCQKLQASLALTAADYAASRGQSPTSALQQAVAAARQAVSTWSDSYDHHGELAMALLRLAESQGSAAAFDLIEEGLRSVTAALSHNLSYAEAYAIRGGLYLLKARRLPSASEKLAAARRSQEAFGVAAQQNPLLRTVYAQRIQQTELLLSELSPQAGTATPPN